MASPRPAATMVIGALAALACVLSGFSLLLQWDSASNVTLIATQSHEKYIRTSTDMQSSMDALISNVAKLQQAVASRPPTDVAQQQPQTPAAACEEAPGPRGLYLGEGRVFCQAKPLGMPMFLEAADRGLTVHICRGKGWEPETSAFFRGLVRSGNHVLDVGTNVGYFTVLFAQLVGPSGHVTGVEASPRTYSLVSGTIELNGLSDRVKVVNNAVYDNDGQVVQISTARDRSLNNNIMVEGKRLGWGFNDVGVRAPRTVPVKTITIDTLVSDWPRLDVVKIDVEGAETGAYAGMRRTLTRFKDVVVIMEVNTVRMGVDKARVFYNQLASDWPALRKLKGDMSVPTTVAELLANLKSDEMLVLTRRTDVAGM